ncbi:MAG: ATP-dependent DNA helicase RecG [Pseudomonadota bacterium]
MIPFSFFPGMSQGIRAVKGVGPQLEKSLRKRGVNTLEDLLFLTPVRYQDRRGLVSIGNMIPGLEAMAAGRIERVGEGRVPESSRRFFEIIIDDDSGQLGAVWFSFPVHLRRTLRPGSQVLVFGEVGKYKNSLQMVHPEITPWDGRTIPTPEVRPVYPQMEEVKAGALRRVIEEVLERLKGAPGLFPPSWLSRHDLTDPTAALQTIHRPPANRPGDIPRPEESRAWKSMALFELLFPQLSLARSRARQAATSGWSFPEQSELSARFIAGLPFSLTAAQKKAWSEIERDMAAPRPMNRLLQGDVGSGKTVVALAAVLAAVDGGRQAAVMAPTEILARQHFSVFRAAGERLGARVELLVGALPEAEKNRIRADTAAGRTNILVGTQSLISPGMEYQSLGLGVIDEQHRFGVAQRLALRAKSDHPDILVMTATPIPRSLAMTLYGDLDVSIIDQAPPGRKPVVTQVFDPSERLEAYRKLTEEVLAGAQAFVVAPRIESRDDDGGDSSSVEDLFRFVSREVLPGIPCGLMHGRMKPEEQDRVMDDFRLGRLRVLTATTVVEVGVDVPAASVILVEGAERFGLAQLHQLRGRVGRGGDRPAFCFLATGEADGIPERLGLLEATTDGFWLAEEDLRLRGPGDAAGLKQSGMPRLDFAVLPRDLPLLLQARDLAAEIVAADPELDDPGFKLVKQALDILEDRIRTDLADVG